MNGADRIKAYLRPRIEQLAYLAAAVAIVALALRAGWLASPIGWALIAALGLAAFWLIRAAAIAAALRAERLAPGVVEISERRVGYYGPTGGGFVSLDEIESIEIRTTADGPWAEDLFWLLHPPAGEETLIIPNGARGADKLLAAFAALPGFDHQQVLRAMNSIDNARFVLWRRPTPTSVDEREELPPPTLH